MSRIAATLPLVLLLATGTPVVAQEVAREKVTELSETSRLADRRTLSSGERAYAMGDATGLYPAAGWHIRGEMGGFWSQPIKLLDGVWFAVDGQWLTATEYVRGWGYQRFEYASQNGIRVHRTEFVPEGSRSTVIGLTFTADQPKKVRLELDAHSELMPSYPWGWTTPSADTNRPDSGAFQDNALAFSDANYAAVVGSSLVPLNHALGPGHRGPQEPAVVCPAEGTPPPRCDDSAFGRGTGGRLEYQVDVRRETTVWFAVAGSDNGQADARREFDEALKDPKKALHTVRKERADVQRRTEVDLPGDRLLQRSVEWSKQNLADSVQAAENLRIRDVDEGKAYPEPKGTLRTARWSGAGFPDYPWLFGTDGEYTAFASVAAGQFDVAKDHLRALRDVSDVLNDRSGKVAHEIVPTGDVYFGANDDAGNTDETVKFPSAVALLWRWTGDNRFRDEMYDFAVRNLRYAEANLDQDGDGWLEGLGNVERAGMGVEKLDSTVYFVRGLRDLADLARSRNDSATSRWADAKAADLEARFDRQWWVEDGKGYAESIDAPDDPANDNRPVFQRHWTGVTPLEAVTTLATPEHARTALAQRERDCYTGDFGLYHTGTGPTSDPKGNPGPSCDPIVSTVAGERATYSLNTAVMAVAEGNYGRLEQQRRYTTANARIQLDPSVWETPGAMPEVAPSPDSPANIDRHFTDRSMMLQAWGAYGVLWPVVHQQLGVSPDLGNRKLAVVPQLPPGQDRIAGRDIHVGGGTVAVTASRQGDRLVTEAAARGISAQVTIGAVLPPNGKAGRVTLNGKPTGHEVVQTARGTEVRVIGTGKLEVRLSS